MMRNLILGGGGDACRRYRDRRLCFTPTFDSWPDGCLSGGRRTAFGAAQDHVGDHRACFLACFPLPVAFPQSFTAGGGTIYVADLLTLLVLALVLSVPSAPRMKMLLVGALVVLATYAAIGLINHGDPSAVVRDLRGPVEVLALCAGLLVVLDERDPAVIRILVSALAVMVIGTAAVLVFETATRSGFFDLRSQDAVLYLGRQVASYSATRLTPPNDVLCAISGSAALMLWMQGRVKARQLWWFWPFVISGLAVGLANFSRNNLIAILAVVLAGTFLGGSFLRVVSRIVPLVLSALAILGSFVTFLVIYSPQRVPCLAL